MTEITDEYMNTMRAKTRLYALVLLKQGPNYASEGAGKIIWEHARRNFQHRDEGILSIVCPVADDSHWSGVGIYNGTVEEIVALMEGDPGVKAGIFEYEVHPVRSFPGDALPA